MAGFDLRRIFVSAQLDDVSTASSVYIPVTDDMEGEVIEVRTCLGGAIATSDATLTVNNTGNSMGTITIANASSAEGDIDTLVPVKTDADRFLSTGQYIEIVTDGASTNAVPVGIVVVIKR